MSSADIERAFGVHCSVDNFGFAMSWVICRYSSGSRRSANYTGGDQSNC